MPLIQLLCLTSRERRTNAAIKFPWGRVKTRKTIGPKKGPESEDLERHEIPGHVLM